MNDGMPTTAVKNALKQPTTIGGDEREQTARARAATRASSHATATMFVESP